MPCRLLPALVFLFAAPAAAQRVAGVVTELGSNAPVMGAFVVLLDESGVRRAAGLSGDDGGFLLTVPTPGRYRLQVERIGYATTTSEAFEASEGAMVVRHVAVAGDAVKLPPIEVGAASRCVLRPEEGEPTWALWSEARKALEVTRWAEEENQFAFDVLRFYRVLDTDLVVRREEAKRLAMVTAQPFVTETPAQLARLGYVRRERRSYAFYAPDAAVLLSDSFLDRHCFRRVVSDSAELVGLAFEPVDPRAVAEVAGTLWLDAEDAELRYLEFRYVNPELRGKVDPALYGGVVEFEALPNGAWVVSRWRIRMPEFGRCGLIGGCRLSAFSEEEAEIMVIATPDGDVLDYYRLGALLTGRLLHPDTGRPLSGAQVQLIGTPYTVAADSTGYFALDGLPENAYRIEYTHPSLFGRPRPILVRLSRGDTTHIETGGNDG